MGAAGNRENIPAASIFSSLIGNVLAKRRYSSPLGVGGRIVANAHQTGCGGKAGMSR